MRAGRRTCSSTVHQLDAPFTRFPGYRPTPKTIAAHPQSVDLALLGKTQPNPWGKRGRPTVHGEIDIEAGKNLTFATRLVRVKAGRADAADVQQSRTSCRTTGC